MQTHLKSRQQQRQSYRDDFPVAARVDDSVAADFDDSKSKKRVNTPRLFFWWRKAKKSRDVVALSIVFLLTFFLSYSLTSSSSSSSFESNSFGPAVQRGLALRKKFAEQSAASSNHAYRYSNSHHALEYSTRRQLLATAYPEIDEISPPVTTCSVTGESYVVQGADTAGDFGSRMCCSSYYATEVTFCGYTTTAPSFEYAMHVTSGRTSTTSISSGATETGEGDCKTYDTSAAPAGHRRDLGRSIAPSQQHLRSRSPLHPFSLEAVNTLGKLIVFSLAAIKAYRKITLRKPFGFSSGALKTLGIPSRTIRKP